MLRDPNDARDEAENEPMIGCAQLSLRLGKRGRVDGGGHQCGLWGVERSFEAVVEASGNRTGLATAMTLVAPRGTIVLKTTVGSAYEMELAPLVIDEVRVLPTSFSRCSPHARLRNPPESGNRFKAVLETGDLTTLFGVRSDIFPNGNVFGRPL